MRRTSYRWAACAAIMIAVLHGAGLAGMGQQAANEVFDPLAAPRLGPPPVAGPATEASAQNRFAPATPPQLFERGADIRPRGNVPAVTLDRFRDPAPARASYALIADVADPAQAEARRLEEQIRQATGALRAAEGEQDKATATRRLTDLLNEYFDKDVERREAELAQVEERLKNLRDQLDRRREKKQEIIDLQLKVAQNEADGLGFFRGPAEAPSWPESPFRQTNPPAEYPPASPGALFDPDHPNRPAAPQPAWPPATRGRGGRGGRSGQSSDYSGSAEDVDRMFDLSPQIRRARASIAEYERAIKIYHATMMRYPSAWDQLTAAPADPAEASKWAGPYLPFARVPSDPWRRPFKLASPGKHNPDSFDIWSVGPDGQDGTADDIGNWN